MDTTFMPYLEEFAIYYDDRGQFGIRWASQRRASFSRLVLCKAKLASSVAMLAGLSQALGRDDCA